MLDIGKASCGVWGVLPECLYSEDKVESVYNSRCMSAYAVSVCFSVQDIPGLTERESDGEVPLVCAVWQWGVWVTCVLSRASLECSRRSGLEGTRWLVTRPG